MMYLKKGSLLQSLTSIIKLLIFFSSSQRTFGSSLKIYDKKIHEKFLAFLTREYQKKIPLALIQWPFFLIVQ